MPDPCAHSITPGAVEARRLAARQFRVKTLMLAVALAAVGAWILRDPAMRGLLGGLIGILLSAALLFLGLMGLGALGFAIWAAVEWAIALGRWPDESR